MRLIDADALKECKFTAQTANGVELIDVDVVGVGAIDTAPTIDSLNLDVHIGGRCCGKRQRLLDELRPKGNWVKEHSQSNEFVDWFKCSNCGVFKDYKNTSNYCPNCGADMRGDK